MERLTKRIKGTNYCSYELKAVSYKELFDLKNNSEIEDYVNPDLTLAIDKLGKLEDLLKEYNLSSLDELKYVIEKGLYQIKLEAMCDLMCPEPEEEPEDE